MISSNEIDIAGILQPGERKMSANENKFPPVTSNQVDGKTKEKPSI